MGFVVGAYQAVEQVGGGHRASPAVLWRGEDLRHLNQVALTVLPLECAGAAVTEVESVAAVRHPHLLPVIEVAQEGDRIAVVGPWPVGGRLAELIIRRGRLSVPETLTVLIPLAAALAVAHASGIRHGGLAPETVWFDGQGRPLLGPLAVSRLIAGLNEGIPILCRDVAPEVVRGERLQGAPPTVAADIFSLGSIALHCLTTRSAWPADDPTDVLIQSAAGLWPDPPDDAGPAELRTLVRAMLQVNPERRPDAGEVAAALAGIAEPGPIDFSSGPAPAPASTNRWRGWSGDSIQLRSISAEPAAATEGSADARAERGEPTVSGTDNRSSTHSTAGLAATRVSETAGRRAALHQRLPTPGPGDDPRELDRITPAARAGIALLVGLLITLVVVQVCAWVSGRDQPVGPVASAPNWPDVVAQLDAARAAALAAADPAMLDEVYEDRQSPSFTADASTIEQLAQHGWRVIDGVHEIHSVSVETADPGAGIGSPDPPSDEPVRLAVVDVLPPRVIVDGSDQQVGLTPARAEQRRILVVGRTDAGYRILAVEPG